VKTWFQAFAFTCNLYRYTEAEYARYDAMSARDVLLNGGNNAGNNSGGGGGGGGGGGASPALYDRFLAPILCALMFAPPEELSAAAAFDVLYGYVLVGLPVQVVQNVKRRVSD
jgi:hypothetical protein